MLKTFLFGILVLGFLTQIPFISSASCNGISPENLVVCQGILNSGLSEEETILLISNLEYNKKYTPDHDYVFAHNIHLDISSPPDGIQKINSIYIKEAWQDLLTAMPSVLYNKSLYVPEKTKVFSKFNYRIQLPHNYYSSRYPRTDDGDCQREYFVKSQNAENRVFVNGLYQGSGELVQVSINSDSEIKTEYSVDVVVGIKHYEWDSRRHCRYDFTEYRTDSVQIRNVLPVKYYKNNLFGDLEFIKSYTETKEFRPRYNNSIEINFKDSSFRFKEFVYSINYSKYPYNIYTLVAEDYHQEQTENILKDREDILVKNSEGCKIYAWDFFNKLEKNCETPLNDFNFSIKTEKLEYKPNEEIVVNIYPSNILANVSYAGETKEAIGQTTFIAKNISNKITAKYEYFSDDAIIFIQEKDRLKLLWDLSVFGFLNYFLYCVLIRMKWGRE